MKHCFFHLDFPAFMFLKRHNKQPVPADRTAFLLLSAEDTDHNGS
ncbi:hypothetical protein EFW57_01615 [Bacillus velezensis]|nr:hypothetical protein B4140_1824 [Bacillus amyloliquefaciens]RAP14971.1 hypothetical protein HS9_00295 [Bacillus velezensis]RUR98812.1 hypothetical protein EFW57_01615 [Bacillus velezensis]